MWNLYVLLNWVIPTALLMDAGNLNGQYCLHVDSHTVSDVIDCVRGRVHGFTLGNMSVTSAILLHNVQPSGMH